MWVGTKCNVGNILPNEELEKSIIDSMQTRAKLQFVLRRLHGASSFISFNFSNCE